MAEGLNHGGVDLVRLIAQEGGPLAEELAHEGVQVLLLFGHARQKGASQELRRLRRVLHDAAVDAPRVLRLREHRPNGIEREYTRFLIALKGDGEFFIDIAVVDAAEKPVKAAVVLIDDILPRHDAHPTESNSDSCCASACGSWPRSTASSWRRSVPAEKRRPLRIRPPQVMKNCARLSTTPSRDRSS